MLQAGATSLSFFTTQTQPVGFGKPPYLVIGFIGPVRHILNIAF